MWCFAFEIWYLKVISVERWFSPREAFENHAVNIHGKKRSFGQLSMSTPRTVALPKTVDSKVEIFSQLKTKHDHSFSSLRWRLSELRQRNVQFVAKSSPGIKSISSDTGILDISLILFSQLTSMINDINSSNEMARHVESHQQNCKDCSFKCNNPRSLEMHKRAEHNFKCKKCKLTLSTKEALGTHTTVAHMFKCQKCGTLFEHKTLLEKHFRASHMFKCPSCPQVQFFFCTLERLSIFLNIFSQICFLICFWWFISRCWTAQLPWQATIRRSINPARLNIKHQHFIWKSFLTLSNFRFWKLVSGLRGWVQLGRGWSLLLLHQEQHQAHHRWVILVVFFGRLYSLFKPV